MTAVIFDMDGTLFQTDLILEWALEETFVQLRELGKWENENHGCASSGCMGDIIAESSAGRP